MAEMQLDPLRFVQGWLLSQPELWDYRIRLDRSGYVSGEPYIYLELAGLERYVRDRMESASIMVTSLGSSYRVASPPAYETRDILLQRLPGSFLQSARVQVLDVAEDIGLTDMSELEEPDGPEVVPKRIAFTAQVLYTIE